ncbi:MAG: GWxTD domain-containing protein [Thermaurantimonas sp.]|uniref:GWxTD domain-containing protein n=1 Tax=Thermaurantimonas sp. TaxID=2681568 RepID=UPI00391C6EAF
MQKARNSFLNIFILKIILITFSFSSCGSKKSTLSNINFAYLYQPSEVLIRPDFFIQLINEDSLLVHYQLNKEEFLYVRNSENQQFESQILIKYAVIPNYELPQIVIDSGSFRIREVKTENFGNIVGKIPITLNKKPEFSTFLIVLTVRDEHRNLEYPYFLLSDRKSKNSYHYYLPVDTFGNIYLKYTAFTGDIICIHYNSDTTRRVFVKHFDGTFPIALPPFSAEQEIIYTNEFKIAGTTNNLSGCYHFKKPGFYLFQTDTSSLEGYYLIVRDDDYPLVNKRHQLVEPLRYLTTQKEFSDLQASHPDSIKYMADQFWLARAGSVERAKNLVKAYYSRVQRANELFTSFKEGWKTDRGMIYIIFGPPNVVYRYADREVWIYGDDSSALQYRFTFTLTKLPFSGFYYVLERNENYRFIWGQAVDAWRNGRVYSIKDIKREQDERDQQLRYQRYPYFWF